MMQLTDFTPLHCQDHQNLRVIPDMSCDIIVACPCSALPDKWRTETEEDQQGGRTSTPAVSKMEEQSESQFGKMNWVVTSSVVIYNILWQRQYKVINKYTFASHRIIKMVFKNLNVRKEENLMQSNNLQAVTVSFT